MKPSTALVTAVVAALLVAGCAHPGPTESAGAPSTTAGQTTHDAADVAFATDMIPHHRQAVALAHLVPERSTNPAVIRLASGIAAAQGPEIETMTGFLAQWGAGTGAMPDMAMQGMVDDATMATLTSLRGPAFDTLFLQSMIGHHEGAIAMAKTELAAGANADAKALAQQIVTGQQAELAQMHQMLGR